MKDFLIVCMLEPIGVGAQFTRWPLHMTVLPWFKAPDLEIVIRRLKPLVAAHKPLTLQIGERAYFGPAGKLPVMRLENTAGLQAMHMELLAAVTEAGWLLEGRYTGERYTPHVTQQAGHDAAGKLYFDKVYIAEALPQGYRRIAAAMELGI